jgi:hypothetical protein
MEPDVYIIDFIQFTSVDLDAITYKELSCKLGELRVENILSIENSLVESISRALLQGESFLESYP